jgi:hypothetical protein
MPTAPRSTSEHHCTQDDHSGNGHLLTRMVRCALDRRRPHRIRRLLTQRVLPDHRRTEGAIIVNAGRAAPTRRLDRRYAVVGPTRMHARCASHGLQDTIGHGRRVAGRLGTGLRRRVLAQWVCLAGRAAGALMAIDIVEDLVTTGINLGSLGPVASGLANVWIVAVSSTIAFIPSPGTVDAVPNTAAARDDQ